MIGLRKTVRYRTIPMFQFLESRSAWINIALEFLDSDSRSSNDLSKKRSQKHWKCKLKLFRITASAGRGSRIWNIWRSRCCDHFRCVSITRVPCAILRTAVEQFQTRERKSTKYNCLIPYRELISVTKLVILQLRSHICCRLSIELDSDRFIFGSGLGGI